MAVAKQGVHAHGCPQCRDRYQDACDEPHALGLCRRCQGLRVWELLYQNALPRDCCRLHSRPATKDELKTYRLAKTCPWFRCSICSRTFPYDSPLRSPA